MGSDAPASTRSFSCILGENYPKSFEQEEDAAGFVIYVDTERYVMTEENGTFHIRGIDGGNPSLPPMEMIIEEMPEVTLEEAAASVRGQLEGDWETITESLSDTEYPRISFSVYA